MSESGHVQSAMNISEHKEMWERFKTLMKWAAAGLTTSVLLAVWIARLWHY